MAIFIHDACVLIDIANAGITDAFAGLDGTLLTTDLVRAEIVDSAQKQIVDALIASEALSMLKSSPEEMAAIAGLQRTNPVLSIPDCSVLFHAELRGAIIMTNEKALRGIAKANSVEVHGVLWLFDTLVKNGAVPGDDMANRLELVRRRGSHLPEAECAKLIRAWCGRNA